MGLHATPRTWNYRALLGFFTPSLYAPNVAASSDDDVQDGDTTAAGVAPATSSADEEDRTVQQAPDPKITSAIAKELSQAARPPPRAGVAVPSPTKPGIPLPRNVTSKRMTVVGLAPPAVGSAAAPPTARAPTTLSPLATTMDKKIGPTSTNPTAAPASSPRPNAGTAASGTAKPAQPAPLSKTAVGPQAKLPTAHEADEEDASITATAPAPRVTPETQASTGAAPGSPSAKPPPLPLTVPGPVQIREMPPPEEEADETEVRTVVAAPPSSGAPSTQRGPSASTAAARPHPSPKPAVSPASVTSPNVSVPHAADDEELEDSVTTQAPSAVQGGRLPEEDPEEPKTSPPLRMPPPTPAAGRSPFDEPPIPSPNAAAANEEHDDAYNVEDSVTTRGPAIGDYRLDDSVTADSPVVDHPPDSSGRWPSPVSGGRIGTMSQALGLPPKNVGLPPAIEDGTEGTTNRFAGQSPPSKKAPPPRPNATLASPAALNLPPKVSAIDADDEDDLQEENRTAIMVGAPVKPTGPTNGARGGRSQIAGGAATHLSAGVARARAPVEQSSSESGLRIAAPEPQAPPPHGEERASLGAMMAGALHGADRGSGAQPREYPSQPLPVLPPHQVPHHFPASEPNLALGATLPANSPHLAQLGTGGPMAPMPQMQQYDFASTIKKPRYGLLVGLVAVLSFAIPLVLFLWLHQNVQEPYVRAPAEVASDHQALAPPPGKGLAPPAASSGKRNGGKK